MAEAFPPTGLINACLRFDQNKCPPKCLIAEASLVSLQCCHLSGVVQHLVLLCQLGAKTYFARFCDEAQRPGAVLLAKLQRPGAALSAEAQFPGAVLSAQVQCHDAVLSA